MYLNLPHLISLVLLFPPSLARPTNTPLRSPKALYLLSNNLPNSILALSLSPDGLLTGLASLTPTSGSGSNGLTLPPNSTLPVPASPDALFSQSALTVSGTHLFAVNAGSNTLSMFIISKSDPLRLRLIGTEELPGEFPTTVGASERDGVVCVGVTGRVAGVSCAGFDDTGLGGFDTLRGFNIGQTTPPLGPTNTVSHVFFVEGGNGIETRMMVTVKGDPAVNNTGFIASFGVGRDRTVESQGKVSSPEGTAVLFGAAVIPGGKGEVLITDASFGAAVVGADGKVKGKKAVVDGQAATCWAAISPKTGTGFVTDVGKNRLVEMDVKDGAKVIGVIDLEGNGDKGLIDLAAAGELVYALSPGDNTTEAAVTVVNVTTKRMAQHVKLGKAGVNGNAMGMALGF